MPAQLKPLSTSDCLTFGKYRGRTVNEVMKVDHKYLQWAMKENILVFNEYLTKLLK